MFDFGDAADHRPVQAILTSRMNDDCLKELHGSDRRSKRAYSVSVICLVPQNDQGGWDFQQAIPVLSRDISQVGLSVLHETQLQGDLLVEIPRGNRSDFVRCAVRHNSDLGHGFYHIGLSAKEVVRVEAMERNMLERRLADFEAGLR